LCEYAVLFLVNHCRDGSVPDFSLVRCACGGGAAMMAASALILALWPNFFLIMTAAILPGATAGRFAFVTNSYWLAAIQLSRRHRRHDHHGHDRPGADRPRRRNLRFHFVRGTVATLTGIVAHDISRPHQRPFRREHGILDIAAIRRGWCRYRLAFASGGRPGGYADRGAVDYRRS